MDFFEAFLWFIVLVVVVKFFFGLLSVVLVELNWGNESAKAVSVIGLYVSTLLSLLLGLAVFAVIYQRRDFSCSTVRELITL